MKALWKSLSSCSAALLDAGCVAAALMMPMDAMRVLAVVAAHLLFSAAAAASLLIAPPAPARRALRAYFVLCFALSFFVPVMGALGLLLASLVGWSPRKDELKDPWIVFELDEELAAEPAHARKKQVTAARISNLLRQRGESTAEQRFQAVLQVRYLAPREAVQVLKLALKDSSDEVRLFAFSRIEKMRDERESAIKQLTSQLGGTDVEAQSLVHLRLAESHYEIAYLGLAEGAVLQHALDAAHEHAMESVRLRPGAAPAEYLLGRVLLQKKEYSWALAAFERAVYAHYPRAKVLPYMAECAFRQRRYEAVRSLLRDLEMVARDNKGLQPVVDFWR
jgi:hypothetical protein